MASRQWDNTMWMRRIRLAKDTGRMVMELFEKISGLWIFKCLAFVNGVTADMAPGVPQHRPAMPPLLTKQDLN